MQMVRLPETDLEVSRLVLGCWGLSSDFHWGERDEKDSLATIRAAVEAGINFFDTAEMYADGASERLLGRALAERRDGVVIASKPGPGSNRPADIEKACDASLERLGTDHIDLYQTHWFAERAIPVEDTWGAMLRLVERGKVRAVGVCNAGIADTARISALRAPATNQLPYNLLWRAIEDAILPDCRSRGIGVLVYSPLMHGLLAGKYASAAEVPDGRARTRHFSRERPLTRHSEAGCEEATFAAIAAIEAVARSLDRSPADVSLAWLLERPGVTAVIAGASHPRQVKQNLLPLSNPLPADAVAELDHVTSELKSELGPNPDMWQDESASRFH